MYAHIVVTTRPAISVEWTVASTPEFHAENVAYGAARATAVGFVSEVVALSADQLTKTKVQRWTSAADHHAFVTANAHLTNTAYPAQVAYEAAEHIVSLVVAGIPA